MPSCSAREFSIWRKSRAPDRQAMSSFATPSSPSVRRGRCPLSTLESGASMQLDLVPVWTVILGVAVFMYVLLDGFDLGVGILFPFAPSDAARDHMINSVAPIWDGNETWL